jgi:hypothetical protein
MLSYFPKYFSNKAIVTYLVAFLVITIMFYSSSMPTLWMFWGIVEILLFFILSNILSKKWASINSKAFKSKIFWYSFLISLLYVTVTYFLYIYLRGEPFEYDPSDGIGYHNEALWYVDCLNTNKLKYYYEVYNSYSIDDKGYLFYLDRLYVLIDGNIYITRVIKCLYRAWMGVIIYKLASRNFGENVGRMAAIFCMLMPHFSFYAASHRKEMEMILIAVLAIERIDYLLKSKSLNIKDLIITLSLIGISFTFRTVLGVAVTFAFAASLFFISNKLVSKNKRITLIAIGILSIILLSGGVIYNQVKNVYESKISGTQGKDMEWRSQGNSYAKYAGAAVFAPMIVAIPFPTMVDVSEQYNQQRLNGGYYIKNILAFFVMFTLYWIIKNKQWRNYVLIYGYTFSYLLMIAFSNFAHSERFHLPALPFLLILAAYGVSLCSNKQKKYYSWYCYGMCVVAIAWNMFKLAGRGLA